MKNSKQKNDGDDGIRIEHDRLKSNLEQFKQAREVVQRVITMPVISNILGKFRKDAEDMREALVSAAKPDIEKTQAGIVARRSICGYLENAYVQDIEEAERALKEFESRNQLFIQADGNRRGEEPGTSLAVAN